MAAVIDRYPDFKELSTKYIKEGVVQAPAVTSRRSTIFAAPGREDDIFMMKKFCSDVIYVRAKLAQIVDFTQQSKAEAQAALSAGEEKQREKHERRCKIILDTAVHKSGKIKTILDRMRQENFLISQKPELKDNGDVRMRLLMHEYLCEKFKKVMNEFYGEQRGEQDARKGQLTRQYKLVKPQATEEELEALHDTKLKSNQVFQVALSSADIKEEILRLRSRRDSMLEIERTVIELSGLFREFSVMVREQGETLDDINYYAGNTVDNLDYANIEMAEGVSLQRRHQGLCWCCCYCYK